MIFGVPMNQPPCQHCRMPVMFVGMTEDNEEHYRCACGAIEYFEPEVKNGEEPPRESPFPQI